MYTTAEPRILKRSDRRLGIACLIAFATHAIFAATQYHPAESLWACHFSVLLVGLGLLTGSLSWLGAGAYCLLFGTPLWLVDVACGAAFTPSSAVTHGVGWIASINCLPRLRNQGLWWKTPIVLMGLQLVCHLVTPSELNINAAFRVYQSFESVFPSYWIYELSMMGILLLLYGTLDLFLIYGTRAQRLT